MTLTVAFILGYSAEDITGRANVSELAEARRAVAWAAHHATRYTLGRIGRAFGGRDHTTIRQLVIRADRRRGEDDGFRLLTNILLGKAHDRRAANQMERSR